MSIPAALTLLTLVVGVPLNLWLVIRLWRLSRPRPDSRVLRERGVVATVILATVVVFGIIFWNNDLPVPFFDGNATKLITRGALLILAIGPAARWLWLYRGVKA